MIGVLDKINLESDPGHHIESHGVAARMRAGPRRMNIEITLRDDVSSKEIQTWLEDQFGFISFGSEPDSVANPEIALSNTVHTPMADHW